MVENKICCIFNYSPHYRKSIYELMDREIGCDFYFGENILGTSIKSLDKKNLRGFKRCFKNYFCNGKIVWQSVPLKLVFYSYTHYIFSLDKACISQIVMMYLCRLLRKKVFIWTHGWYGNESMLMGLYKKIIFFPVNGFFLYGNYARQLMTAEKFSPNKLHVIANSLDYEVQVRLRKNLVHTDIYSKHFGNIHPVVLFIGRLEPGKKLDKILNLCYELKSEKPINCVFIGDGVEKPKLERLAKDMAISTSVWFYGTCYDEVEKSRLIFDADLCLSPGNVGLTCMDCLAYGTPVITHDNPIMQMPEFEAISKGRNGDFFMYENWDDMRNVVKMWLIKHPYKTKELLLSCYEPIDTVYNPNYQIDVLKKALS